MSDRGITLLIIDDEPALVHMLSSYLEDLDFSIVSAEAGEDALQRKECFEADVTICDMRMKGMNGEEVIKALHQKNRTMKFLIHTGSADYHISKELRQIGISEEMIIEKPVLDLHIFADKIEQLVQWSSR